MDKERLNELLLELIEQDWSKSVVGGNLKAILEKTEDASSYDEAESDIVSSTDDATPTPVLMGVAHLDLELTAIKSSLRQLAEMPANSEGDPLLLASRFDPIQMQAILKVLQDIIEWTTV